MRAAVYARLSKSKGEAELQANITDQQSIGEQIVERHGWKHVGTFTDDGIGAFKDNVRRPAWNAMLASRPDVIVVRDIERLGRHPREYVSLLDSEARVLEWLDEENGGVRWDADPVNPDNDVFQQRTVGARSYSRKISSKVKRKMRTQAADGHWPHGGRRTFGYHRECCRDADGMVTCKAGTVRQDEAEVIREIAHRWLAGETLSVLCRALNDRNISTPGGYPWQYGRLRALLGGTRIAGIRAHTEIEIRKSEDEFGSTVETQIESRVETKGNWEPIIDEDLHRRLVTAASGSAVKRTAEHGSYTLVGLIRCGTCGKAMYGRKHKKRSGLMLRYVCGDEACFQGIAAEQTDDTVAQWSFFAMLAPQIRDAEQLKADVIDADDQVRDFRERLAELDDAYWKARTMPKERWLEVSTSLQGSLESAQQRQKDLRRQLTQDRDLPQTAEDLSQRWLNARSDPRARNRLLRIGVDHVLIHPATGQRRFDPTRIEIHYRDGKVQRVVAESAPDGAELG